MTALLPFGIDEETRLIQEVSDVPRGRIALALKLGLCPKKGSKNEWHFAHAPKAKSRPDQKCNISFESACRLFVIDLLNSRQIPVIMTPAIGDSLVADKGRSRSVMQLEGVEFVDPQEYGDVNTEIKGGVLGFHRLPEPRET